MIAYHTTYGRRDRIADVLAVVVVGVAQAVKWGLVAFLVMAGLRLGWKVTASSKAARTLGSVVAERALVEARE
jgi:hypothetical protein